MMQEHVRHRIVRGDTMRPLSRIQKILKSTCCLFMKETNLFSYRGFKAYTVCYLVPCYPPAAALLTYLSARPLFWGLLFPLLFPKINSFDPMRCKMRCRIHSLLLSTFPYDDRCKQNNTKKFAALPA